MFDVFFLNWDESSFEADMQLFFQTEFTILHGDRVDVEHTWGFLVVWNPHDSSWFSNVKWCAVEPIFDFGHGEIAFEKEEKDMELVLLNIGKQGEGCWKDARVPHL